MRVRLAKVVLRSVNFSCSLIILALLATTFTIFNATKHMAPRNGTTPWAPKTQLWPQITLLVIACLSLLACVLIMYNHCKGKKKRADKAQLYYTIFAMGFFALTIVIWAIGLGVIQGKKDNSDAKDLWGWSCKDGRRKELFKDDVSYAMVCRMQVRLSKLHPLLFSSSLLLANLASSQSRTGPSSAASSRLSWS